MTTKPVRDARLVTVVGVPGALSLSATTDPGLFLTGHTIRLSFRQGTETDYTGYRVQFGDSAQLTGLNYSETESLLHPYSAPGVYTVRVQAVNIAGSQSVARNITIYDEVLSAVIKFPSILIAGLNEVFLAEYTLRYGTNLQGQFLLLFVSNYPYKFLSCC